MRQPAVEKVFDELGVEWDHARLPLSELPTRETSQVRLRTANDRVQRMELAMAEGYETETWPAIVVNRSGGRLALVDGYHRVAAARGAGIEAMDAYLIRAGTEITTEIAGRLNELNGDRLSDLELRHLARQMMAWGKSQVDTARSLSVTPSTIRRWGAEDEFRRRTTRLKMKVDESRGDVMMLLNRLRNDSTFTKTCELVMDAGLTLPEVKDAVRAVEACNSEEAELLAVGALRDQHGAQIQARRAGYAPKKRKTSEGAASVAAWKSVCYLLKRDAEALADIPPEHDADRPTYGQGYRDLATKLDKAASLMGY